MLALPQGAAMCATAGRARTTGWREDFDGAGHLSRSVFEQIGVPIASRRLPVRADPLHGGHEGGARGARRGPERIHVELFNGSESMMPGVVGASRRDRLIRRAHDAGTGALVSFARSGIAAHWDPTAYQSLLELAEACDVPVRWSCRTGVCHNCESGLVSGAVVYGPEPLDQPAEGNLLVCCSQPIRDVVIDL